jgi:heparan sulfate 6-O-sulfotransferase HS6ST1
LTSIAELVGCYNKSGSTSEQRDRQLLASAKTNLERLAYFGLTEEQHLSQYLFQQTFQLEFRVPFQQFNTTHSSLTTQGR